MKKYGIKIICVTLLLILVLANISVAMDLVEDIRFYGKVTATKLNIRSGPGTKYDIVENAKKNDIVQVLGKFDDWYLVQTNKNIFGLCKTEYIEKYNENSLENRVLNKINEERNKNGVKKLIIDDTLSNVAKLRASDIKESGKLTYLSEKYGTVDNMLKTQKIDFVTVGENMAKYDTESAVIDAFLEKNDTRTNIICNGYRYIGVGYEYTQDSQIIIVLVFVGK